MRKTGSAISRVICSERKVAVAYSVLYRTGWFDYGPVIRFGEINGGETGKYIQERR